MRVYRWQRVARHQSYQLVAARRKEWICIDYEGAGVLLGSACDGGLQLVIGAGTLNDKAPLKDACRLLSLLDGLCGYRIAWIGEHGDRPSARHQLRNQLESLSPQGVILPCGWLRLSTRPTLTGSSPMTKTIGI